MIITQATDEDAFIILELQKIAYQSEAKRYNDYSLPPLTQTIHEILDDLKNQFILKALIDGNIVGSVRAYTAKDTCFIGRLIVHPEQQNKGIGTKLLNHIEKYFSKVKRFELFTGHESVEALHIYYKLGYKIFKKKKLDTHTLVFLEKHTS